jgi:hypothetical protein
MKTALLIVVAAALTACASGEKSVRDAATTPLSDLNVVRADIPPVLAAAQKAPYAVPIDKGCAALDTDVQALDTVLGADLDTPASGPNPGLIERGAADALRNTAEGVIPFRGWVRKLSGAERYSREVAAAIAAGTVRRAYLKGIAQAGACGPPAGPRG